MPQAWRIVKAKYATTAFKGEGAARTGGRWNSRGIWMVYTSGSRSLAALETLVHLNPPVLFNYVIIPISFDDALMLTLSQTALPKDWLEEPAPPSTKEIGDTWVRDQRSPVLELPSVIVPGESNFLVNPMHPDFKKMKIGKAEPFAFDPRLL